MSTADDKKIDARGEMQFSDKKRTTDGRTCNRDLKGYYAE